VQVHTPVPARSPPFGAVKALGVLFPGTAVPDNPNAARDTSATPVETSPGNRPPQELDVDLRRD